MPDNLKQSISAEKWQRLGRQKKAGALIPLFSVYSKNSFGIGDFSDLKLVVDWAGKSGNSIIQLLPMNAVGAVFCPYDAVSSFALEPAYISLKEFIAGSGAKKHKPPKGRIDYNIKNEKIEILSRAYISGANKYREQISRFRKDNSYWIEDFALYMVLKQEAGGRAWYEWEDRFKQRDKAGLEQFSRSHAQEINFQVWLQWLAYGQFKDAKEYAASKGVLLKGDLPILVSRDSACVWAHPEFFKLEFAAGAPPDMYCAKGQRWGMPTYNREALKADGFRFLSEKLKYAQNFYDILRVDHVVGLFRIWSIPCNEPLENIGLNGFFDPRDEALWGPYGREILSAMAGSTNMLLCAEDLGIIPKVCTDTIAQLGIPGNDVQRWVKDWSIRHDFLPPDEYRVLSVAMLSTHDTTNWPGWWENEAGTVDEQLFINKCNDRGIDYCKIKPQLFNAMLSRYGRLRWNEGVDSVEKLIETLGKGQSPPGTVPKDRVGDFIDLYLNSYREKEKLWKHLGLKGKMREGSCPEIVRAVLAQTLNSNAVFCINSIIDYLYLSDILKGNPYQYRINTPGTVSPENWSLVIPLSLEELLMHKVTKEIRKLIEDSGRM